MAGSFITGASNFGTEQLVWKKIKGESDSTRNFVLLLCWCISIRIPIRDMKNRSRKYWIEASVWLSTVWDSFSSKTPCAIVGTTLSWRCSIWTKVLQNLRDLWNVQKKKTYSRSVESVTFIFSNSVISLNECMYQLLTLLTEGIFKRFSGSKWISFMILARRTGSSLLRNLNEVSSSPLVPAVKNSISKIVVLISWWFSAH